MQSPDIAKYEAMAAQLEDTGQYRVLRRLRPGQSANPSSDRTRRAVFIDIESTGLDPKSDETIEIGLVPFEYDTEGQITSVLSAYQSFQEPSTSIPEEISALTGITDGMVSGKSIDLESVRSILKDSVLVVAHNAAFDRPFAEKIDASFAQIAWACSMTQVPWQQEGFDGARLSYLVASYGLFYDSHRAVDDCYAGIELLSRRLPRSGDIAMSVLLRHARRRTHRVWAEGAPYDSRLKLKSRGYRWSDGSRGGVKAWFIDVEEHRVPEEIAFIQGIESHQGKTPLIQEISALDRFSLRA